jgi:hypothetical protein
VSIDKDCPAVSQLSQLKAEADQLGEEQCKLNAPGCQDYQTYWKTGEVKESGSSVTTDSEKAKGFGKLLIISAGETFRRPVNLYNPKLNWNETFNATSAQLEATESQLAFARFVKLKYNISTDFIVNTESSDYQEILISAYPKGTRFEITKASSLMDRGDRLATYGSRLNSAVKLARGEDCQGLEGYGAVFFIRPDLYLKSGFFTSFHLFDKLTFPFLEKLSLSDDVHVSDMALYVPKDEFNIFVGNTVNLRNEHSLATYYLNERGLMINTVHSHDTAVQSNPLFSIVNRPDGPSGEQQQCEKTYKEANTQSKLTHVVIN